MGSQMVPTGHIPLCWLQSACIGSSVTHAASRHNHGLWQCVCVCVCACVCVCVCERERERQTDRQTDRQTETDRHTERDRDRDRQTDRYRRTETDRQRDTQTTRLTETVRQTDRQTDRQSRISGNRTEEKVFEKRRTSKEDLKGLTEVESKSCQEHYVVILTAVAPLT